MTSSPPADRPARGPGWVTWGGLWLVAVLLRVDHLADVTLWYDEAAAWKTISYPWWLMSRSIESNVHPPAYYALLKLWVSVWGESILAMRALSVVLGLIAVGLVGRLAREVQASLTNQEAIHDRWVAWTASALYAIHPLAIEQSQQVRMYSLGIVLAAGLGIGTVRLLRQPLAVGNWLLVIVCGNGLVLTHYYGLFTALVAVVAIGVVSWRELSRHSPPPPAPLPGGEGSRSLVSELKADSASRKRLLLYWLLALWFTGQTIFFWGATFLEQQARVRADYWIPPFRWSEVLFAGAEWVSYSQIRTWGATVSTLCGILWVVVAICLSIPRNCRNRSWLLVTFALGPVILSTLMSLAGRNLLQPRYWSFAHLFVVVGVAVGCCSSVPLNSSKWARLRWLIPLLWCAFWSGQYHRHRIALANTSGLSGLVSVLRYEQPGNEPILVQNPFLFPTIQHGLHDEWHHVALIDEGQPLNHFQGAAIIGRYERMPMNQVLLNRPSRFWIVVDDMLVEHFEKSDPQIPEGWHLHKTWSFYEGNHIPCRIELREYRPL